MMKQIEIKCPECQKFTFRFSEDLLLKEKFICPVCDHNLFDIYIKPSLEALKKYNSTQIHFIVDTSGRAPDNYTHYCLNVPSEYRKLKHATDWSGFETAPKGVYKPNICL